MRSVCFFASYFEGTELPYYMRYYLTELRKHFTDLVFIYSNESLSKNVTRFFSEQQIDLFCTINEGFDFGQWYKASQKWNIEAYERVAFVNDSCVLFTPMDGFFEWTSKNYSDVYGITESEAVSRHMQSYFLLFERKAIPLVNKYLLEHKLLVTIDEVIAVYEIGLSKFLIENGCTLRSYVDNRGYRGEYSPYYYLLEDHIKQGVPLIKKKIVYSSFRTSELKTLARMGFNISVHYYINLIKKYNPNRQTIDLEKLLGDKKNEMGSIARLSFNIRKMMYKVLRPIYKLVK